MGFKLKSGFVGEKERFIARRYLEELISSKDNSKLFVEKKHNGSISGIFFNEFEELLSDNCVEEFKDIESYIEIETDNLDEDDIKDYEVSDEVKLMFDTLKQNESLYVMHDGANTYLNVSKEELILEYISDGQYSFCYENINAALLDLENENELVSVFAYNKSSSYDKQKYLEELNECKNIGESL